MALEWDPTLNKFKNEIGVITRGDISSAVDLPTQEFIGNSYQRVVTHEDIIATQPRKEAFKNAILKNQNLFWGKTVLDVGAGTGFLSILAAQAGAGRVIGIEETDFAHLAYDAVRCTEYNNISIVKGRVEDLPELPHQVKQVDIIICEPQGYGLFYESTFQAVLNARDKWLKPGGIIFPDTFSIFMCGLQDIDYDFNYFGVWDRAGEVAGLDLSHVKKCKAKEVLIRDIDRDNIVTNHQSILTMDLHTAANGKLDFMVPFHLSMKSDATIHAFVTYFDIGFSKANPTICFSTSPYADRTTWRQMQYNVYPSIQLKKGDEITGYYGMEQKSNSTKDIDFKINFTYMGKHLVEIYEERKYRNPVW